MFDSRSLEAFDPALAAALRGELERQERHIELIASENYVSPRVLAAQGSALTNKYADGYPGHRDHAGCEHADVAESLAIERACKLFGAGWANVQPYSGSQANLAAYLALLAPGDTLLGMRPAHGGHRTHGAHDNASGQIYGVVFYDVDARSGEIDYDQVASLARERTPKLIVAGFSAYSRVVDWARFRAIADEVGALLADIAHVAGLIAAGLYPNPVPLADLVTTTTHKTLRGPRGGMLLARARSALTERADEAVFPGTQGGPLMHVVAAKAVAFAEALEPEFSEYQKRTLANARTLTACLAARGYRIVSGGTDNHMLLVDLRGGKIDAQRAERALEAALIAVNRVSLPGESGSEPTQGSGGLRLGTPAVTTRGFGEAEIGAVGSWIADILDTDGANAAVARVRRAALDLCDSFPVLRARACGAHEVAVHCPFCSFEDTKVIDSRLAGEGRQVRRRRECLSCGERFTTFEQPELVMPYVVKRDDRREPFDEGKLRSGILAALQKRPVQREDIERSIEHIAHSLQTIGEREVSSRIIGDLVMEELRRLDVVAYVRFASVYRSFQDVTEFQQEIERLQALPSLLESREQMSLLPGEAAPKKPGSQK